MTALHVRNASSRRAAALAAALGLPVLFAACAEDPAAVPAAAEEAAEPIAAATLVVPAQSYPDGVREALLTALGAYEEVRAELAADRLDGVGPRASRLAAALGMAQDAPGERQGPVDAVLAETAKAAASMADAGDLEAARVGFAETSRLLIPLVAADPTLVEDRHIFECPMRAETGFAKWIQTEPLPENPYMGPSMLACATDTSWTAPAPTSLEEASAHAAAVHGDPEEIAWYTCSMHPSVKSPDPGQCPICNMALVPVTKGEVASGVVFVDAARRQRIGVTTAPVETRPLTVPVRAVGKVVVDETRLTDVSVKYEGWIGSLAVNQTGQPVRRGQTLFTLYSPDLYAAQQDLLAALASQRAAAGTAAPDRADYLVEAARRRLRLWDLSAAQIERLEATGKPVEHIPILSPASGYVVEKNVVEGSAVAPGMQLFRIAGLDRVWVEAEVYESELPLLEVGDAAEVSFPNLPGRTFPGTITFVMPFLDGMTRTGRVRIELANPNLELKPDMYANVTLTKTLGEALVVPEDAVLYAGERRFVFVDLGEGRLKPLAVTVGRRAGDQVEIVSGLAPGDVVVTSGNFLVAAESRLKLAMEQWGRDEGSSGSPAAAPAAAAAAHRH